MKLLRAALILAVALLLSTTLSGCLVMGYSSEGGWWVWPGSLVLTLILVLGWYLTRH